MTIKELLKETCARRGKAVALRHKQNGEWKVISYDELLYRVRTVSQVLDALKVRPRGRVGLYLPNCPAWVEIYFGIVGCGATAIPVDAKLRPQEVAHVLRNSEAEVLFAEAKNYHIVREVEDQLPTLKAIVLLDGKDILPADRSKRDYLDYADACDTYADAAQGAGARFGTHDPQDADIASIIYTSGTTGRQKGAMLTHENFCSDTRAALQAIKVSEADNFLLVLPLHHAFAFTGNLLIPVASGSEISFIESLKTVGENVREVSPTVLIAVPLLIEKMYNKIRTGLRKKKLAYVMFKTGIRGPIKKGILRSLGGKLRVIVAGGAPSDPAVLRGFKEFGIPVLEGYGLTETAPVLTLNPEGADRPGTVGKPLPGIEIKIDHPNNEGIGEVIARGPCIMDGYYRNPEATAEVIRDGWFYTGDLGRFDTDGYLTITGRKKNLIVNREGKNIYPEEVEHQICTSPYILEALVLGYEMPGERGERVGVIVVPDQEMLDARVDRSGGPLSDDQLSRLLTDEVKKAAGHISDYKRPRRIQIRNEEFEKTSTQKVKRYLYAIETKEVS